MPFRLAGDHSGKPVLLPIKALAAVSRTVGFPPVIEPVSLADPRDDEANVLMRMKHLGTHRVASTVVCSQLLDPRWKLEVEAIAAA